MMTNKINITTVGALIDFLKDIPRDTEIDVENYGRTGWLDGAIEIEKTVYTEKSGIKPNVCLNVKAESGYY